MFLSLLMRSPFVGSFRCAANASNSSTLTAGGEGTQNHACFWMVDTVRHFGGSRSSAGSVECIRWIHDDSFCNEMNEGNCVSDEHNNDIFKEIQVH